MKRAAALLSLVWLSACFPHYAVEDQPNDSGGTSGTGGVPLSAPSCDDKTKNGSETGIDCGMAACGIGCDPGLGCETNADCKVGLCTNKVCQAASCNDQLLNGNETDQDCGGDMGCNRCTPGQRCASTSDCDGGACTNGQCQKPSCKDKLLNGDETDLDCGGTCNPCGVGLMCVETKDCDQLACSKGTCQPASCDDKILNQDEGDQDCGGSCTTKCDTSQTCKVASDCVSGVCTNMTCMAPSCIDKVQNGKEPAVDCGIDCPTKCKQLDACYVSNDCASGSCVDGRCLPKSATGKTLSPLGWIATASNMSNNTTPGMAIDGNASSSYWITGAEQTVGMWFQIDMKATQIVFSLEIVCNDSNDYAQAIDVAFSDTGTDWGTVTPIVNDHMTTPNDTITFSKPAVGRYVRLTLTGGKNYWWRMDELRLKQ